jgi:cytochrome c peroxidase
VKLTFRGARVSAGPPLFLCFAASLAFTTGCGDQGAGASDDAALAQRVIESFAETERMQAHVQLLTPSQREEHEASVSVLRDKIPKGYPEPLLPTGALGVANGDFRLARAPFLSAPLIALGQSLFSETRLSFSHEKGFASDFSCATCHPTRGAFVDGKKLSRGVDGASTRRNTPTLFNVAYNSTLTWANRVFPVLEMQAKIPLFGNDPVEMGLRGKEADVMAILRADRGYRALLSAAYGLKSDEQIDALGADYTYITTALAAYQRSLIRFDTKFDRFLLGSAREDERFDALETRGLRLFYGFDALASGTKLPCAQCHSGYLLSDSFRYVRDGKAFSAQAFHNTGLHNVDGRGAYPLGNTGFATADELKRHPEWMGRFRTPPLRFVAATAPYGHDGSLPDLNAVVSHYAAGGRATLGKTGANPFTDERVKRGFVIADEESEALIAFLKTLGP